MEKRFCEGVPGRGKILEPLCWETWTHGKGSALFLGAIIQFPSPLASESWVLGVHLLDHEAACPQEDH